jgi:hypothetical protein
MRRPSPIENWTNKEVMQWAGDVLGQQEIPQEDLQKLTRLTGLALLRCERADTLRQKYDISHATSDLLYPSIANLKRTSC